MFLNFAGTEERKDDRDSRPEKLAMVPTTLNPQLVAQWLARWLPTGERSEELIPALDFEQGKSLGCTFRTRNVRLVGSMPLKSTTLLKVHHMSAVWFSLCWCGSSCSQLHNPLPALLCNMKCQKAKGQPPLADAKSGVRIVYLLTLNGRAVRQVRRLIRALYHPDHSSTYTLMRRQDYMFRELLECEQLSNVKLARERHATIWGGASLLTMLLESMRLLVHTHSHWKWDFLINLSESDFPIKSNQQLVEFLSANRRRNFVKSHGREVQRFVQKQGLDKTFVECEAHMWRAGWRRLPWGVALDGGSDWVALSRDFVVALADWASDPLLAGLVQVFKYTLLPAEATEGRPLFFARKFEPIISQAAILQLEEWLYGPYPRSKSYNIIIS
ncbi:hypothetical protein LSTR_LSTR014254 [Laodelphax striatellus]|uniref:protein xylosyltransferase n=1 Tax=Laodelphax striatellus TaxID=195883 RepID=A0A482XE18_LAOST|nr:hypothetical protein LSTR_LSTR014254 [Laodelphax striatellus]